MPLPFLTSVPWPNIVVGGKSTIFKSRLQSIYQILWDGTVTWCCLPNDYNILFFKSHYTFLGQHFLDAGFEGMTSEYQGWHPSALLFFSFKVSSLVKSNSLQDSETTNRVFNKSLDGVTSRSLAGREKYLNKYLFQGKQIVYCTDISN